MQLLVYYCSTTFPDVNVINPKGDRLDIINTISKDQTRKFRRTDVFLDSCTGDYYGFNQEQEIWVPLGNTGLHHLQTLETYGSKASYFIQKTKKYK